MLTDRQTDRQTNERGQKHIPPPLSEVNNSDVDKRRITVVDADNYVRVDTSYYSAYNSTSSVPCRPGLAVPLDSLTTVTTTVSTPSTTVDYRGPPGPPGPQVSLPHLGLSISCLSSPNTV